MKILASYRYEIVYIDNDFSDRSREKIQILCANDTGGARFYYNLTEDSCIFS